MEPKEICEICDQEIEPVVLQQKGVNRITWNGAVYGHPIIKGICCIQCDMTVILPARLRRRFHISDAQVSEIVANVTNMNTSKGLRPVTSDLIEQGLSLPTK